MKIKCPNCGEIFEFSPNVIYNGSDTGKSENVNNTTNNKLIRQNKHNLLAKKKGKRK